MTRLAVAAVVSGVLVGQYFNGPGALGLYLLGVWFVLAFVAVLDFARIALRVPNSIELLEAENLRLDGIIEEALR